MADQRFRTRQVRCCIGCVGLGIYRRSLRPCRQLFRLNPFGEDHRMRSCKIGGVGRQLSCGWRQSIPDRVAPVRSSPRRRPRSGKGTGRVQTLGEQAGAWPSCQITFNRYRAGPRSRTDGRSMDRASAPRAPARQAREALPHVGMARCEPHPHPVGKGVIVPGYPIARPPLLSTSRNRPCLRSEAAPRWQTRSRSSRRL